MGPPRAWSMGARWRSPQKPWPEAMRIVSFMREWRANSQRGTKSERYGPGPPPATHALLVHDRPCSRRLLRIEPAADIRSALRPLPYFERTADAARTVAHRVEAHAGALLQRLVRDPRPVIDDREDDRARR